MKKIAIVICGLALAGCNNEWAKISVAVGQIDNTLAKLSEGSIPKACAFFIPLNPTEFSLLPPTLNPVLLLVPP